MFLSTEGAQGTHQAVTTTNLQDKTRLGEAASVLARSFQDASQFVTVCPDSGQREKMLHIFFRVALEDALRHGLVSVALVHERIVGVAAWLPPGYEVMTLARQARAALPLMRIFLVTPRAFLRLIRLGGAISAFHPREPHWYLVVLGVSEEMRGQRVGSRLVREDVAHAERTGYGCYLETMLERNVRLYEKHGFQVMRREEGLLPGGPPFWFMWRPARG
jgi:ribosomal protein S18 acetylase RimI-like enzyme